MIARRLTRTLALAGTATALLGVTAAPAAAPKKITPAGVDGVKLGMTFAQLRAAHLVGKLQPGCELAGANARSARLRAPLKGTVNFTNTTPRKVTDITVTGGATARGVGIGATKAQILAKFPKAKFDHTTEPTFGITLVRIPKNGGGRLRFAIAVSTHKVTLIGIPFIAFCE
jgi:hypothetical protein